MEPTKESDTRMSSRSSSSKQLMIVAAVVVVLVAVIGLVAMKPKKASSPTTNNTTKALAAAEVAITANGFSPATIKVKKGQTVTWINRDEKAHQVESDPYPTAETLPDLKSEAPTEKGQSYSFTFEQTGTFTYHDRLNPIKLKGTVIVE